MSHSPSSYLTKRPKVTPQDADVFKSKNYSSPKSSSSLRDAEKMDKFQSDFNSKQTTYFQTPEKHFKSTTRSTFKLSTQRNSPKVKDRIEGCMKSDMLEVMDKCKKSKDMGLSLLASRSFSPKGEGNTHQTNKGKPFKDGPDKTHKLFCKGRGKTMSPILRKPSMMETLCRRATETPVSDSNLKKKNKGSTSYNLSIALEEAKSPTATSTPSQSVSSIHISPPLSSTHSSSLPLPQKLIETLPSSVPSIISTEDSNTHISPPTKLDVIVPIDSDGTNVPLSSCVDLPGTVNTLLKIEDLNVFTTLPGTTDQCSQSYDKTQTFRHPPWFSSSSTFIQSPVSIHAHDKKILSSRSPVSSRSTDISTSRKTGEMLAMRTSPNRTMARLKNDRSPSFVTVATRSKTSVHKNAIIGPPQRKKSLNVGTPSTSKSALHSSKVGGHDPKKRQKKPHRPLHIYKQQIDMPKSEKVCVSSTDMNLSLSSEENTIKHAFSICSENAGDLKEQYNECVSMPMGIDDTHSDLCLKTNPHLQKSHPRIENRSMKQNINLLIKAVHSTAKSESGGSFIRSKAGINADGYYIRKQIAKKSDLPSRMTFRSITTPKSSSSTSDAKSKSSTMKDYSKENHLEKMEINSRGDKKKNLSPGQSPKLNKSREKQRFEKKNQIDGDRRRKLVKDKCELLREREVCESFKEISDFMGNLESSWKASKTDSIHQKPIIRRQSHTVQLSSKSTSPTIRPVSKHVQTKHSVFHRKEAVTAKVIVQFNKSERQPGSGQATTPKGRNETPSDDCNELTSSPEKDVCAHTSNVEGRKGHEPAFASNSDQSKSEKLMERKGSEMGTMSVARTVNLNVDSPAYDVSHIKIKEKEDCDKDVVETDNDKREGYVLFDCDKWVAGRELNVLHNCGDSHKMPISSDYSKTEIIDSSNSNNEQITLFTADLACSRNPSSMEQLLLKPSPTAMTAHTGEKNQQAIDSPTSSGSFKKSVESQAGCLTLPGCLSPFSYFSFSFTQNSPHPLSPFRCSIPTSAATTYTKTKTLLDRGAERVEEVISPTEDESTFAVKRVCVGGEVEEKKETVKSERPPSSCSSKWHPPLLPKDKKKQNLAPTDRVSTRSEAKSARKKEAERSNRENPLKENKDRSRSRSSKIFLNCEKENQKEKDGRGSGLNESFHDGKISTGTDSPFMTMDYLQNSVVDYVGSELQEIKTKNSGPGVKYLQTPCDSWSGTYTRPYGRKDVCDLNCDGSVGAVRVDMSDSFTKNSERAVKNVYLRNAEIMSSPCENEVCTFPSVLDYDDTLHENETLKSLSSRCCMDDESRGAELHGTRESTNSSGSDVSFHQSSGKINKVSNDTILPPSRDLPLDLEDNLNYATSTEDGVSAYDIVSCDHYSTIHKTNDNTSHINDADFDFDLIENYAYQQSLRGKKEPELLRENEHIHDTEGNTDLEVDNTKVKEPGKKSTICRPISKKGKCLNSETPRIIIKKESPFLREAVSEEKTNKTGGDDEQDKEDCAVLLQSVRNEQSASLGPHNSHLTLSNARGAHPLIKGFLSSYTAYENGQGETKVCSLDAEATLDGRMNVDKEILEPCSPVRRDKQTYYSNVHGTIPVPLTDCSVNQFMEAVDEPIENEEEVRYRIKRNKIEEKDEAEVELTYHGSGTKEFYADLLNFKIEKNGGTGGKDTRRIMHEKDEEKKGVKSSRNKVSNLHYGKNSLQPKSNNDKVHRTKCICTSGSINQVDSEYSRKHADLDADAIFDQDINDSEDDEHFEAASDVSSETSFLSATSDILMATASPTEENLAFFEGCGTSKAGEGMARIFPSDAPTLNKKCLLDLPSHGETSEENVTPLKQLVNLELDTDWGTLDENDLDDELSSRVIRTDRALNMAFKSNFHTTRDQIFQSYDENSPPLSVPSQATSQHNVVRENGGQAFSCTSSAMASSLVPSLSKKQRHGNEGANISPTGVFNTVSSDLCKMSLNSINMAQCRTLPRSQSPCHVISFDVKCEKANVCWHESDSCLECVKCYTPQSQINNPSGTHSYDKRKSKHYQTTTSANCDQNQSSIDEIISSHSHSVDPPNDERLPKGNEYNKIDGSCVKSCLFSHHNYDLSQSLPQPHRESLSAKSGTEQPIRRPNSDITSPASSSKASSISRRDVPTSNVSKLDLKTRAMNTYGRKSSSQLPIRCTSGNTKKTTQSSISSKKSGELTTLFCGDVNHRSHHITEKHTDVQLRPNERATIQQKKTILSIESTEHDKKTKLQQPQQQRQQQRLMPAQLHRHKAPGSSQQHQIPRPTQSRVAYVSNKLSLKAQGGNHMPLKNSKIAKHFKSTPPNNVSKLKDSTQVAINESSSHDKEKKEKDATSKDMCKKVGRPLKKIEFKSSPDLENTSNYVCATNNKTVADVPKTIVCLADQQRDRAGWSTCVKGSQMCTKTTEQKMTNDVKEGNFKTHSNLADAVSRSKPKPQIGSLKGQRDLKLDRNVVSNIQQEESEKHSSEIEPIKTPRKSYVIDTRSAGQQWVDCHFDDNRREENLENQEEDGRLMKNHDVSEPNQAFSFFQMPTHSEGSKHLHSDNDHLSNKFSGPLKIANARYSQRGEVSSCIERNESNNETPMPSATSVHGPDSAQIINAMKTSLFESGYSSDIRSPDPDVHFLAANIYSTALEKNDELKMKLQLIMNNISKDRYTGTTEMSADEIHRKMVANTLSVIPQKEALDVIKEAGDGVEVKKHKPFVKGTMIAIQNLKFMGTKGKFFTDECNSTSRVRTSALCHDSQDVAIPVLREEVEKQYEEKKETEDSLYLQSQTECQILSDIEEVNSGKQREYRSKKDNSVTEPTFTDESSYRQGENGIIFDNDENVCYILKETSHGGEWQCNKGGSLSIPKLHGAEDSKIEAVCSSETALQLRVAAGNIIKSHVSGKDDVGKGAISYNENLFHGKAVKIRQMDMREEKDGRNEECEGTVSARKQSDSLLCNERGSASTTIATAVLPDSTFLASSTGFASTYQPNITYASAVPQQGVGRMKNNNNDLSRLSRENLNVSQTSEGDASRIHSFSYIPSPFFNGLPTPGQRKPIVVHVPLFLNKDNEMDKFEGEYSDGPLARKELNLDLVAYEHEQRPGDDATFHERPRSGVKETRSKLQTCSRIFEHEQFAVVNEQTSGAKNDHKTPKMTLLKENSEIYAAMNAPESGGISSDLRVNHSDSSDRLEIAAEPVPNASVKVTDCDSKSYGEETISFSSNKKICKDEIELVSSLCPVSKENYVIDDSQLELIGEFQDFKNSEVSSTKQPLSSSFILLSSHLPPKDSSLLKKSCIYDGTPNRVVNTTNTLPFDLGGEQLVSNTSTTDKPHTIPIPSCNVNAPTMADLCVSKPDPISKIETGINSVTSVSPDPCRVSFDGLNFDESSMQSMQDGSDGSISIKEKVKRLEGTSKDTAIITTAGFHVSAPSAQTPKSRPLVTINTDTTSNKGLISSQSAIGLMQHGSVSVTSTLAKTQNTIPEIECTEEAMSSLGYGEIENCESNIYVSPESTEASNEKLGFIKTRLHQIKQKISAHDNPSSERAKSPIQLPIEGSSPSVVRKDVESCCDNMAGKSVRGKWRAMVEKSKVVAIRESLKVKLTGQDERCSVLPPPISPTPHRKYKWARGDAGIWKKVYLDEIAKEGAENGDTRHDNISGAVSPVPNVDENVHGIATIKTDHGPKKDASTSLGSISRKGHTLSNIEKKVKVTNETALKECFKSDVERRTQRNEMPINCITSETKEGCIRKMEPRNENDTMAVVNYQGNWDTAPNSPSGLEAKSFSENCVIGDKTIVDPHVKREHASLAEEGTKTKGSDFQINLDSINSPNLKCREVEAGIREEMTTENPTSFGDSDFIPDKVGHVTEPRRVIDFLSRQIDRMASKSVTEQPPSVSRNLDVSFTGRKDDAALNAKTDDSVTRKDSILIPFSEASFYHGTYTYKTGAQNTVRSCSVCKFSDGDDVSMQSASPSMDKEIKNVFSMSTSEVAPFIKVNRVYSKGSKQSDCKAKSQDWKADADISKRYMTFTSEVQTEDGAYIGIQKCDNATNEINNQNKTFQSGLYESDTYSRTSSCPRDILEVSNHDLYSKKDSDVFVEIDNETNSPSPNCYEYAQTELSSKHNYLKGESHKHKLTETKCRCEKVGEISMNGDKTNPGISLQNDAEFTDSVTVEEEASCDRDNYSGAVETQSMSSKQLSNKNIQRRLNTQNNALRADVRNFIGSSDGWICPKVIASSGTLSQVNVSSDEAKCTEPKSAQTPAFPESSSFFSSPSCGADIVDRGQNKKSDEISIINTNDVEAVYLPVIKSELLSSRGFAKNQGYRDDFGYNQTSKPNVEKCDEERKQCLNSDEKNSGAVEGVREVLGRGKKHSWSTVAESLKRFQKSIASTSDPRSQLQRSREHQVRCPGYKDLDVLDVRRREETTKNDVSAQRPTPQVTDTLICKKAVIPLLDSKQQRHGIKVPPKPLPKRTQKMGSLTPHSNASQDTSIVTLKSSASPEDVTTSHIERVPEPNTAITHYHIGRGTKAEPYLSGSALLMAVKCAVHEDESKNICSENTAVKITVSSDNFSPRVETINNEMTTVGLALDKPQLKSYVGFDNSCSVVTGLDNENDKAATNRFVSDVDDVKAVVAILNRLAAPTPSTNSESFSAPFPHASIREKVKAAFETSSSPHEFTAEASEPQNMNISKTGADSSGYKIRSSSEVPEIANSVIALSEHKFAAGLPFTQTINGSHANLAKICLSNKSSSPTPCLLSSLSPPSGTSLSSSTPHLSSESEFVQLTLADNSCKAVTESRFPTPTSPGQNNTNTSPMVPVHTASDDDIYRTSPISQVGAAPLPPVLCSALPSSSSATHLSSLMPVTQKDVSERKDPIKESFCKVRGSEVTSPRLEHRRSASSARLISVSVWDTHDGDKALRPPRRLWDTDDRTVLAGISEIEEVHTPQDIDPSEKPTLKPAGDSESHDPSKLSVLEDGREGSQERVRASRSPVRPSTKFRHSARRSLSLPNGELSYNDVKIQYKDGHFVAVETSKQPQNGPPAVDEAGDGTSDYEIHEFDTTNTHILEVEEGFSDCLLDSAPSATKSRVRKRHPLQRSLSAAKDLRGGCVDSEWLLRVEILSLIERGFIDPHRLLREAAMLAELKENSGNAMVGRNSRSSGPVFLSLPRRRSRGQRPLSMEETGLWRNCSKSQQSLVSQGELGGAVAKFCQGKIDSQDYEVKDGSSFSQDSLGGNKRNDSFTEAMGSTIVSKENNEVSVTAEKEEAYAQDAMREDSRRNKLISRSHGFIQRMLQKRKGSVSEKSLPATKVSAELSEEIMPSPQSNSCEFSFSIPVSSQSQTSPGKQEGKHPSVARRMSLRSIFRRKSFTDLTSKKSSSQQDLNQTPRSPLLSSHINSDDHDDSAFIQTSPTLSTKTASQSIFSDYTSLDLNHAQSQASLVSSTSSCSEVSLNRCFSQEDLEKSGFFTSDNSSSRRSRSLSGRSRVKRGNSLTSSHVGNQSATVSIDDCTSLGTDFRDFSEDTLTPRALSPNLEYLPSMDGDSTLVESPSSCRFPSDCRPQLDSSGASSGHFQRAYRDNVICTSASTVCSDGGITSTGHCSTSSGDITSSNSNDSGIQKDVNVNSSAESIQSNVRLRKSPSPGSERPKSDIAVRWADLLGQVMGSTEVDYRQDAVRLIKKPRPRSDIGGWRVADSSVNFQCVPGTVCVKSNDLHVTDTTLSASTSCVTCSTTTTTSTSSWGCNALNVTASSTGSASPLDVVELRRGTREGSGLSIPAALAKLRRMSTPQPITLRKDKPPSRPTSAAHLPCNLTTLGHARSMPENLDKLNRKKNYFSLIAPDAQSILSQQSIGDESSDESEYSMDFHADKTLGIRSSRVMLAALDQMLEEESLTFAEALWDHVTMDLDELGFRAGDLIRVTDATDKHWWYGITDEQQGWFPATFVRLRVNQEVMEEELDFLLAEEELLSSRHIGGLGMTSVPFMDKHQARANVVKEIICAERDYVKHLRDVVEGYVKNVRKRPEMFPEEKIQVIFSNIEEIYTFATNLLSQLDSCVNQDKPHLSEIGQCFLNHTKSFEMYSDYCNNHPAACEELRELYRNKRYRHFFEACRLLQDMIEIPLEGFLLTPVQKICKYHLQLAELLKFTHRDHADYENVLGAMEAMKRIALLINERKRKMESLEKLAAWQMMVDDWEGADILEDSSESIFSGELNKINHSGWSQERYFFLFDHQLIYCKKDLLKKSSFCYKGRINMDNCEVVNITDGRDCQYNVTVRNAWKLHETVKDKWYLLVAKSPTTKSRWLKAFQDERRRVMEDAENNFNIPSHVKNSVISSLKRRSHLHKPKGSKFTRANSSQSLISSSKRLNIDAIATLPRRKGRSKDKVDSDGVKTRKINWFFLSKGKS